VNSGDNNDPYADNDCYLGSINVEEGADVYVEIQGKGSVSSNPVGLRCSDASCQGTFKLNSTVSLTPHAFGGWKFAGWSNDECSGSGSICTVTMSQARTVIAIFEQNGEVKTFNMAPILQLLLDE
jgi:hypothetical protein